MTTTTVPTINRILLLQPNNPAYQYVPDSVLSVLPAIRSTENQNETQKQCVVKYFAPGTSWTWYGLEYDPAEGEFFGYEVGPDGQGLTYFYLETLKSIKAFGGLPVERDIHFTPTSLKDVKALHGGRVDDGDDDMDSEDGDSDCGFVGDDEDDDVGDDFLLNSEATNNPLPYLRELASV